MGVSSAAPGGHTDVAEEAKLTVIVAPLTRARMSIVVDKVTTTSTPGTRRPAGDSIRHRREPCLPGFEAETSSRPPAGEGHRELRKLALQINGPAAAYVRHSDRVVAKVMGRDGKLQDEIYAVE